MLKIIIADDEVHIRELIAQCINRSELGMEVVGTAEHGAEAFELIEKHDPDILITDVCMPGTSGLALIERIRNNTRHQGLKTIIISGYDEFLYVQKALKLGVSGYLLKPFSPEELLANLEDIRLDIERKAAMAHNLTALEAQFKTQMSLLQENILKQLINLEGNPKRLLERAEAIGMKLDFPQYFAGLIKLGSEETGGLLDAILLSAKERYFDESIISYGMRLDDNLIFILFGNKEKQKGAGIQHIKNGITRLNDSLKRYYHVSLSCALGNVRGRLEEVRLSYEEARYVMRTASWEGSFFAEYTGMKNRDEDAKGQSEALRQMVDALILSVKMADREEAVTIFQRMLKSYDRVDACSMENIDILLLELLFRLEHVLQSAGIPDERMGKTRLHESVKQRLLYGDMWEIKRFMEDMIGKACICFEEINQSKGERIVSQIKTLIEGNLRREELDLEWVASQLFFSSNYLRKLFKQAEGVSFSDYLIRRRMETARDMLRNGFNKIVEISEACGYSNQRYFASAFKKFYGDTPTAYREKMEDEGNYGKKI